MNPTGLHLHDVTLRLHGRQLLGPLTRVIPPGEVLTVMGESGSGKSSLLAFLCGTLAPAFEASGTVFINDAEISNLPPQLRGLGILFQDDLLFPHLSVGQNLAFGLSPKIRSKGERSARIARALDDAGLSGFEHRDPGTLSGGQRARVALMRVLLSEPRAILLDEPFSKLDSTTRLRFREFVFDHVRKSHLPTLMVSHDSEDALAAAGPILQLPADSSLT